MPSADVLALNPELGMAPGGSTQASKRPKSARPQGKARTPQNGAQALTGTDPGSSFQGRLDRAAQNGWHALESPDALLYRWRQNGGVTGPWLSYEEATAYGARCCPWGAAHGPGEE